MSVVRAACSAVHVTAGERMFSCRRESDAAGSYQTRQGGWEVHHLQEDLCWFYSQHCPSHIWSVTVSLNQVKINEKFEQ